MTIGAVFGRIAGAEAARSLNRYRKDKVNG